jgi:ribonuclease Z
MGRIVILGSAYAVSNPKQENTHMAFVGEKHAVLVDCPGNPLVRLLKANIPVEHISDLIVTHFHPDHMSGFPLLLMDLWLMGRTQPLTVHGLESTLEKARKLMELFDWKKWPGFFEVKYHVVNSAENQLLLENEDFRVFCSPVHHMIPTIGLRVENKPSGKSAAYSCDTEPCDEVIRLAAGVDILVHESSGLGLGHSSSEQAGEIARKAEVQQLYLIHYPPQNDQSTLAAGARLHFEGDVKLATDLMEILLD